MLYGLKKYGFYVTNNKPEHKCSAYRCGNDRLKRNRFCSKHRHRYHKHRDIVAYTFYLLRTNANRRGHLFTITLDYFRKFCEDTGYIKKKGKSASSLTIDRIDVSKGYEEGNLQVLTNRANVLKQHHVDYSDVPF